MKPITPHRMKMRIATTLLALAATATIATGCNDSNAPDLVHIGRYDLVSVDGETLPLVLVDDLSLKLTVTSGGLTLRSKGRFSQDITLEVVAGGQPASTEHLSCDGTYERSGDSFTFVGQESENCSGMTATGTIDGNTLTVSDDQGETLVFRR